MQRSARSAVYVAVGCIGVGFLLIILGWNNAANLDYAQGQLPYIISGGIGGIALVGVGLTLALVQTLRADLHLIARKLDELNESAGGPRALGGPTAVPEDEGEKVVAGRTTYHRSNCHLVEGRGDLQVMSVKAAFDRGLAPCRVCNPERASA